MATQPPPALPIFYKELIPLLSTDHAKWQTRATESPSYFAGQHAVPLTVDEFMLAQRFYPIVFSDAAEPVPLALFGLNEGVNTFVNEDGRGETSFYVPAYVRRYPFMLARLQEDKPDLSLCFDPQSDMVGEFKDGQPLFEDGKPTENLNNIMKFCEDFDISVQRTGQFVRELQELDLLIDGEVTIQPNGSEQPFVYRGFKMVAEEKLRDLHGDQLRKINQSGILGLIHAHLFSLQLVQSLFSSQAMQGKVPGFDPQAQPQPATADA
ncbi:MAG: SapC family protein [Sphingomonas sp.]